MLRLQVVGIQVARSVQVPWLRGAAVDRLIEELWGQVVVVVEWVLLQGQVAMVVEWVLLQGQVVVAVEWVLLQGQVVVAEWVLLQGQVAMVARLISDP